MSRTTQIIGKKHCRIPLLTEKLSYMPMSLQTTKLYTPVSMTRSVGFLAEKKQFNTQLCNYLYKAPGTLCLPCPERNGRTNCEVLADYIKESTNWATLWSPKQMGGWICKGGKLQHPLQEVCCCGYKWSPFLAEMLFHLRGDLSKKLRKSNSIRALKISYGIAVICSMDKGEL